MLLVCLTLIRPRGMLEIVQGGANGLGRGFEISPHHQKSGGRPRPACSWQGPSTPPGIISARPLSLHMPATKSPRSHPYPPVSNLYMAYYVHLSEPSSTPPQILKSLWSAAAKSYPERPFPLVLSWSVCSSSVISPFVF